MASYSIMESTWIVLLFLYFIMETHSYNFKLVKSIKPKTRCLNAADNLHSSFNSTSNVLISIKQDDTSISNVPNVYSIGKEKIGIGKKVSLFFRRRILNIFDRDRREWLDINNQGSVITIMNSTKNWNFNEEKLKSSPELLTNNNNYLVDIAGFPIKLLNQILGRDLELDEPDNKLRVLKRKFKASPVNISKRKTFFKSVKRTLSVINVFKYFRKDDSSYDDKSKIKNSMGEQIPLIPFKVFDEPINNLNIKKVELETLKLEENNHKQLTNTNKSDLGKNSNPFQTFISNFRFPSELSLSDIESITGDKIKNKIIPEVMLIENTNNVNLLNSQLGSINIERKIDEDIKSIKNEADSSWVDAIQTVYSPLASFLFKNNNSSLEIENNKKDELENKTITEPKGFFQRIPIINNIPNVINSVNVFNRNRNQNKEDFPSNYSQEELNFLSYFPSMNNLSFPSINIPSMTNITIPFPFTSDISSFDPNYFQSEVSRSQPENFVGFFSRESYRGLSAASSAPSSFDIFKVLDNKLDVDKDKDEPANSPSSFNVGVSLNESPERPNILVGSSDKNTVPMSKTFAVKLGKSEELRSPPIFLSGSKSPLATRADFSLLKLRLIEAAVNAAVEVSSSSDANEFIKAVGLEPLISALIDPPKDAPPYFKISVIKGICRLIKANNNLADEVTMNENVINILCDAIEAPFRGFKSFKTASGKETELKMQKEALALIQRFIRSSDIAVGELIANERLKKALMQVLSTTDKFLKPSEDKEFDILVEKLLRKDNVTSNYFNLKKISSESIYPVSNSLIETRIKDFSDLGLTQMARISIAGLGGIPWQPKQPNQRGIRILSFDGGGTKGVLSLAMLDELLRRAGKTTPSEMFDIICGTSTGGIIAALLGVKRQKIGDAVYLYDSLIDKIFVKPSRLRLVSEQATYDAGDWESVLDQLCGDELLLDSNRYNCPRTFCVSTKMNINPPSPKIWRNYNYPLGQVPRYPGTFRIKTKMAIRASTAAPTFFTPIQWNGGLYCDGALVANNPTAIAVQEAKVLFPGVPIDFVLSIGTGTFIKNTNVQSMDWGLLVNQLIASSTSTEDVHTMLNDLLPPDNYYRFNPLLLDGMAIDEVNLTMLANLKLTGKLWIEEMEKNDPARINRLIKALSGAKY